MRVERAVVVSVYLPLSVVERLEKEVEKDRHKGVKSSVSGTARRIIEEWIHNEPGK